MNERLPDRLLAGLSDLMIIMGADSRAPMIIMPEDEYPSKEEIIESFEHRFKWDILSYSPYGPKRYQVGPFTTEDKNPEAAQLRKAISEAVDAKMASQPHVYPERLATYTSMLGTDTLQSEHFAESQDRLLDFLQFKIFYYMDQYGATSPEKVAVQQAMEFAVKAYDKSESPVRSTGEYYHLHPFRAVGYMLEARAASGLLTDKRQRFKNNDLIIVGLLHDVLEDVPELQPFQDVEAQGNTPIELSLTNDTGGSDVFPLTPLQFQALKAITKDPAHKQRALHDVIDKDPTGMAAEIKLYDKLDNLLTMGHVKQYGKLLYNLYEAYSSMGRIGFHASTAEMSMLEKVKAVLTLDKFNATRRTLDAYHLGVAIFDVAWGKIQQDILRDLANQGFDMSQESVKRRLAKKGGLNSFNKQNYIVRKFELEKLLAYLEGQQRDYREQPFSYYDLIEYIDTFTVHATPIG